MRLASRKVRGKKQNEKGVALFIALFALLLLSAIAAAMMFMSTTETKINFNYRDAQRAYFASQAGLEEARERMRNKDGLTAPLVLPTTSDATSVVYIINPRDGETVAPWDATNAYFDDELCHENFKGLGLTNSGANTPCAATAPTGTWYTKVNSTSDYTNTKGALSFKWARITLKANGSTDPYRAGGTVTTGGTTTTSNPDTQICWDGPNLQEVLIGSKQPAVPAEDQEYLAEVNRAVIQALGSPAVVFLSPKGKGTTGTASSSSSSSGSSSSSSSSSTSGSSSGSSSSSTSGSSSGSSSSSSTGSSSGSSSGSTSGSSSGSTSGGAGTTDPCQLKNSNWYSVYMVTSLAVTPNGARRLTQYELARILMPPLPGALTFDGPAATFSAPNSANYGINGNDQAAPSGASAYQGCAPPGDSKNAIVTGDAAGQSGVTTAIPSNRDTNYTGLGGATPNVQDGSSSGSNVLQNFSTIGDMNSMLELMKSTADTVVGCNSTGNTCAVSSPPAIDFGVPATYDSTTGLITNSGATPAPHNTVTYVDGDLTLSGSTAGSGVLVVTGTLTYKGNFSFDGVVLVIGQGVINAMGGGHGQFNGGLLVAKTADCVANSNTPPGNTCTPTSSLGTPTVNWNGGGTNFIQYNSCFIENANGSVHYRVISYRELTY